MAELLGIPPMVAVAVFVYFAGCGLLILTWQTETARLGGVIPVCSVFLAIQHHVFAVGGLLLALTAGPFDVYVIRLGPFHMFFGLERTLWADLLSLACAYVGVRVLAWVVASGKRAAHETPASLLSPSEVAQLSIISVTLLGAAFLNNILGWFTGYADFPFVAIVNYFINVADFTLPGALLVLGFLWPVLSRPWKATVLAYGAFLSLYGLSFGGRGPVLWVTSMLLLGYFFRVGLGFKKRFAVVSAAILLVAVIGSVGGKIQKVRKDFIERQKAEFGLASQLKSLAVVAENLDEPMHAEDFLIFGDRLVERTVRVVLGIDDPPAGWPDGSWFVLLTSVLPRRMFPEYYNPTHDTAMLFLNDIYGFSIGLGGKFRGEFGHGEGFSLFADLWRRFGALGVILGYFVLGVLFGFVSWKAARAKWRPGGVIYAAFFAYNVAHWYIFALIPFVSRMVVGAVVSAFLVSLIIIGGRFVGMDRRKILESKEPVSPGEPRMTGREAEILP